MKLISIPTVISNLVAFANALCAEADRVTKRIMEDILIRVERSLLSALILCFEQFLRSFGMKLTISMLARKSRREQLENEKKRKAESTVNVMNVVYYMCLHCDVSLS